MKVLFDQGTPVPLRHCHSGHQVETVFERNWSRLANGELLEAAESDGFDVFVTTDQNLKYQQNLSARSIAIIVVKSTSWPRIQQCISEIKSAVDGATPGDYVEIDVP